jgi:hypothetical protein
MEAVRRRECVSLQSAGDDELLSTTSAGMMRRSM